MAKKETNYTKIGAIVLGVVVVALIAIFAFGGNNGKDMEDVSATSITEQGQTYFATINMIKINAEAKALKGLTDQRKSYLEKLNSEAKAQEKELMAEKKEIESKQSVLSKEALEKKVMDYQKKIVAYQKEVSEKNQAIEKSYREALQKVQEDVLDEVIKDIASKKKVTMILNSAQVISLKPELDITTDVIKVLDRRMPKARMSTPAGF